MKEISENAPVDAASLLGSRAGISVDGEVEEKLNIYRRKLPVMSESD